MATIDLITYDQKMVTPKDDALIHQFGISNGVLYGCDVTLADTNTLHITGGQGVIYGRQWEITEGDITVTLPASGSLKGRLYVRIDLSNTTNPIELLVQTDVTLPDLTDDDQINVNNSVSELELYTFDVSSLTISNLVKTVETVADGDHADVVQMQNDISQLNSSLTPFADNGWTCRKNADNSYECYISVDVTASNSSSYGGGLYFHQSNNIAMPSVIGSQVIAKIANVQGAQLKILCGDTISIINHNMTVYYLDTSNTSGSSNRCTVGILLIGK